MSPQPSPLVESTAPAHRPTTVGAHAALARDGEYLVFQLDVDDCAISFDGVEEIRSETELATGSGLPDFVAGFVQVRHCNVPVVCLRTRLDLPGATGAKDRPVIIVTHGSRRFGILVDAIGYLVTLEPDDIHPPSSFGNGVATADIMALGTIDARLLTLIDVGALAAAVADPRLQTRQ